MSRKTEQKKHLNKIIKSILSAVFLGLFSYLYISNPDFLKINDKDVFCRIGITTDLERCKKEWKTEYEKEGKVIKKWTALSIHKSKSSAQEAETREAKLQNCEAHPGGRDSEKKPWFVYKIEY